MKAATVVKNVAVNGATADLPASFVEVGAIHWLVSATRRTYSGSTAVVSSYTSQNAVSTSDTHTTTNPNPCPNAEDHFEIKLDAWVGF